jgi:hypothetical protein
VPICNTKASITRDFTRIDCTQMRRIIFITAAIVLVQALPAQQALGEFSYKLIGPATLCATPELLNRFVWENKLPGRAVRTSASGEHKDQLEWGLRA